MSKESHFNYIGIGIHIATSKLPMFSRSENKCSNVALWFGGVTFQHTLNIPGDFLRKMSHDQCNTHHSVLLWDLLISKIDRDMRPPAKLSYRSAIHKKVVFGAGDAWTLPQIQGEVGGDQEPPGNTWRYPMGSKIFLLILNHIWATIHVL